MKKISPLGKRKGLGTFDIDHFDDEWAAYYAQEFLNKYKSWTKSTKKT